MLEMALLSEIGEWWSQSYEEKDEKVGEVKGLVGVGSVNVGDDKSWPVRYVSYIRCAGVRVKLLFEKFISSVEIIAWHYATYPQNVITDWRPRPRP